MSGQYLDGYCAIKASVAGAINLAHAARAQRRLDFIGSEFGASGERHPFAQL